MEIPHPDSVSMATTHPMTTRSKAAPAPKAKTSITDLPVELVSEVEKHLGNLQNRCALSSTSRQFYRICRHSSVKLPIGPNADVRFVLASSARQISDWASSSETNKEQLRAAIDGGESGLCDLAFEVARFGLEEVQAIYQAKKSIIEPLAEKLNAECEKVGVRKSHNQQCKDITTALWDYVTYCELFHNDIRGRFYEDSFALALGAGMRRLWASKCLCRAPGHQHRPGAGQRVGQKRQWRERDLGNLYECHGFTQKIGQVLEDCLLQHMEPDEGLVWENFQFVNLFMLHQGLSTLKLLLHGQVTDPEDVVKIMDVMRAFGATGKSGDGLNLYDIDKSSDWGSLQYDTRTR